MTNLTSVAQIVKKYTKILAAFFILLIIGIFVLLKLTGFGREENLPKLPKLNYETHPAKIGNLYTRKVKFPQKTPKQLAVYQTQEAKSLLLNSQFYADKLAFKNKPKEINDASFGKGKLFTNAGGFLVIYDNDVAYQKYFKKVPPGKLDFDLLKSKASDYLNNLNLSLADFSDPEISYSYLSGEDLVSTTDQNRASFITLTYHYSADSLKIISSSSRTRITMDSNGSVVSFNYKSLNIGPKGQTYPIIGKNEALNLLRERQGKVIEVTGVTDEAVPLDYLPPIEIQNAYLAYYAPAKSQELIQPVWVFEGVGTYKNSPIQVKIAVEAIKGKYYSSL